MVHLLELINLAWLINIDTGYDFVRSIIIFDNILRMFILYKLIKKIDL